MGKASLKRWVLREALNTASVEDSLMCNGSGFQRVGAATEKALSPQVRFLISRRLAFQDQRWGEGSYRSTRLQRY